MSADLKELPVSGHTSSSTSLWHCWPLRTRAPCRTTPQTSMCPILTQTPLKGDLEGLLLLPIGIALLNSRDSRATTAASFLHKCSIYSDSDIVIALQNSPEGTVKQLLQAVQLSCKHDNWENGATAAGSIILRLTKTEGGLYLLLQHDVEPVLEQAFQQRRTATSFVRRLFPDLNSLDLLDAVANICSCELGGKALAPHLQLLIAAAENTAGACSWRHHHCTAIASLASICNSGPDGVLLVAPYAGKLAELQLQDNAAAATAPDYDHDLNDLHCALSAGVIIIQHILTQSGSAVEAATCDRMVEVLVRAVQQPGPVFPLATAALADAAQTAAGSVALATPGRVQILLESYAACVKYNLRDQAQQIIACLAVTLQAAVMQSDYRAQTCFRPVMDLVTHIVSVGSSVEIEASADELCSDMVTVCKMVVSHCLLPLAYSRATRGMWTLVMSCAPSLPLLCTQGLNHHVIGILLQEMLTSSYSLEYEQECAHAAMLAAAVAFAGHRTGVYAQQLCMLAERDSSMREALWQFRKYVTKALILEWSAPLLSEA